MVRFVIPLVEALHTPIVMTMEYNNYENYFKLTYY